MNIITLLYFLVNVECVNHKDANRQSYYVLCANDKCTEKIADGRVKSLIKTENSDYLAANLNDSFDVLGKNKNVFLVRKQLREGLVDRKSIKIVKYFHTPTTDVEISFKNQRLQIFVKELKENLSQDNQSIVNSKKSRSENLTLENLDTETLNQNFIEHISNEEDRLQAKNTINSNSSKLENKIDNLDQLNEINKESLDKKLIEDIDQLERLQKKSKAALEQTKGLHEESDGKLKKKLDEEFIENVINNQNGNLGLEDEKNLYKNEEDEIIGEEIGLKTDYAIESDDKINNLKNEEKDKTSSLNLNQDHQHYVKMNSIESSTSDNSFNNQAESYLCTLPQEQSNEMNFYLDILRSILSELVVDRLPENLVTFLKIKLLISVHLIVFVLLIGIIWFISYFITLIYHSIENKTKLKNQICDLQNQLSVLKNEKQLIKKSQFKSKEFVEERNKLEKTIDNLLNEKMKLELKLSELSKELKELKELNDKIQNENEQFMKEEIVNNFKLTELEDELKASNNCFDDLKKKTKENEKKMEDLNENLNRLKNLINQKDNEIEYLNKMCEELREEKISLTHLEKNEIEDKNESKIEDENESKIEDENESKIEDIGEQDNSDQINHHEFTKLKFDIEKVQKERDEFKSKIEEYRSKVNNLENEVSKFDEYKCKLMNEKEEAERYTEFSKKYLKEKEDELQVELQSMKDELEQVKKLLLNSEKHSSDYWRENQILKNDLNLISKNNEQLRKRIVELMQEEKQQNKIPMPPEIPPMLQAYLRNLSSPTASSQHPQSPSNHSQNNYHQQQNLYNYSVNSLSNHPSFATSPSHSLTNISLRSATTNELPINISSHQTSPKNLNNYSYVYPNSSLPNSLTNFVDSNLSSPSSSNINKHAHCSNTPLQNLTNTNDSNWLNETNSFFKPN